MKIVILGCNEVQANMIRLYTESGYYYGPLTSNSCYNENSVAIVY